MNRIFILLVTLLCCSPQQGHGQTNTDNDPTNVGNENAGTLANNNKSHSNEESDAEKDNDPNWIIAKFTKALVAVGVLQVVACFLQAFIYMRQARLMRKAIDESRESSERSLRAYLTIVSKDQDNTCGKIDTNPHSYSVCIKNTGQTPAYDVRGRIDWIAINGHDEHWPEGEQPVHANHLMEAKSTAEARRRTVRTTVGKDQEIVISSDFTPHQDGSTFAEALEKFKRKEVTIYIFGTIRYSDIYRKVSRNTKIWIVLRHNAVGGYGPHGYRNHNEAD